MTKWQPIETAPKDGTEILLCSVPDATGPLLARFISLSEFMTEIELITEIQEGASNEDLETPDWFYADFVNGGRLNLTPTHWMHLPEAPTP